MSLLPVPLLSTKPRVDSAEGLEVVPAEVSFLCFQFFQDGKNHIIFLQRMKMRRHALAVSSFYTDTRLYTLCELSRVGFTLFNYFYKDIYCIRVLLIYGCFPPFM